MRCRCVRVIEQGNDIDRKSTQQNDVAVVVINGNSKNQF